MPGGITDPVVGYVIFCSIKFVGYSLAAQFLANRYKHFGPNPFKVGGVRTLIGMAVGAAYYALLMALKVEGDRAALLAIVGLAPLRVGEWWFLIWLFFDRKLEHKRRG